MKTLNIKSKLAALALLAGSSVFAAPAVGVGIGIEIGAPPPPPHVRVVRPPLPGPNYAWVNGFYEPVGGQYRWRGRAIGRRGPYAHAVWVAPRYSGHRYYGGYWRR